MAGSVRLEGPWKQVHRALAELPRNVRDSAQRANHAVGHNLQTWLKQAYTGQGAPAVLAADPPPAAGTLLKRRFGKPAGRTPAVKPSGSTVPLHDSGRLANAVALTKGMRRTTVFVRGDRSASGESYRKIAALAEFGQVRLQRVTPAMQAFLVQLYREGGMSRFEGGGGDSTAASDKLPGIIQVIIPGRPVWGSTANVLAHSALLPRTAAVAPGFSWLHYFVELLRLRQHKFGGG